MSILVRLLGLGEAGTTEQVSAEECVPSGPRNVISIVNETSIILEWHPPRETGGRDDVTYNIICKKCRADRRSCSRCDDNVEFVPRQLGLTECRVSISSLWAHTPYTFDIQAINGVSSKSPFPPQHVSVNITTNQADPLFLPPPVLYFIITFRYGIIL
ncbi:ephrin type-B receptor 1 isoform 1 [Cricetulus griseus]|nr:ephrin type-B receptor 1 isoform 1 [Cricetulus griseus]